ncbi:hypothetical protein Leryth_019758 [Lithospermum erythrorhizon]|nr:hypothetical protein Leryth_019758 [Lithospermum erythrorhizon]
MSLINYIYVYDFPTIGFECRRAAGWGRTNYEDPDLRGLLSEHEEKMVIDLHSQLGNRTDGGSKSRNTHIRKIEENKGD